MYATVDEKPIKLSEIALATFAWDRRDTTGSSAIKIHLSENDLRELGARLFLYAQTCTAEEADYFSGEYMRDVPRPGSEMIFNENPTLLATYLDDSFWSRETIVELLNSISFTDNQTAPRYWIQYFKQLTVIDEDVVAEFGLWVAP